MLPDPYRIHKTAEIKEIYAKGKRIKTAHIRLFYFFSKSVQPSQFAFVVSKRTAGRSVDRNRLKRIMRSEVERNLEDFPPGAKVIIQFQGGAQRLSADMLRLELLETMIKAKLVMKHGN